jgi:hypothetical protein
MALFMRRLLSRAFLGLTCLASVLLAQLLYPTQVRLSGQQNVFVVWHDHVIGDALAYPLRIAVPVGAVMMCTMAIALALFWSRNPHASLGRAKRG